MIKGKKENITSNESVNSQFGCKSERVSECTSVVANRPAARA